MAVNIKVGTLGPISFIPKLFGKQSAPLEQFLLGSRPPAKKASASHQPMEHAEETPSEASEPIENVAPPTNTALPSAPPRPIIYPDLTPAAPAPPPASTASLAVALPVTTAPPANLAWTLEAERRNSFFLEWRITDPRIASALASVQSQLVAQTKGDLVVLQSCAVDNLHITMNELTISSENEVNRCVQVLSRWMAVEMPKLYASCGGSPSAILKGIHNFNDRVFFAPIEGPGAQFLSQVVAGVDELLARERFNVKRGKGFAAHITLAKLAPGKVSAKNVHAAIAASGLGEMEYGVQPVSEIVFCVKRLKEEATPPVLCTFNTC